MPRKITLPLLGESVTEATVVNWLHQPGDQVAGGDPLLEVETEKVTSEIPMPEDGVLLDILVPAGETVEVGTLLGWVGAAGEAVPSEVAVAAQTNGHQAVAGQAEAVPAQPASTAAEPAAEPASDQRDLGWISPVVRRLADEHRLDLHTVPGTGRGGRITRRDVEAHLAQQVTATATPAATPRRAPPPLPAQPGESLKLNTMRKAIAEHMVMSKHTSPHVTTVFEVDLHAVSAHRAAHKAAFAQRGVRLTFTAYFAAATVAALQAFPVVNSSWGGDHLQLHRDINLGIAVSLGKDGLIVPVIRQAGLLNLEGLARAVNDLAERARSKQLKPDEVTGGTFSITNHGVSGSLFATPIINQPQAGILGVGVIEKRVKVIEDAIAIRPMTFLSFTFDHRILDGATADYFVAHIRQMLEDWQ